MKLVRILLPINRDGTTDACVAIAVALAKRLHIELQVLHPCAQLSANLTALSVASSQFSTFSPGPGPIVTEEAIELARTQSSLGRRRAKAWSKKITKNFPNIASTFVSSEGPVDTLVATYARLADFTVVPSVPEADDSFWPDVRNGALLSSGRPMLVVPPHATRYRGDTIVVAWKDRPETIRAVVAAAPFLANAKLVRIISVAEPDQDKRSLTGIADYLSCAGVAVKATTVSENSAIGEILVAKSAEAGMLVMGTSGRSQLREWVFGGATHHVLRNTTVPTLMMH